MALICRHASRSDPPFPCSSSFLSLPIRVLLVSTGRDARGGWSGLTHEEGYR